MGQHKHNPNCKLAKEGKLPKKPKRKSKREVEKELYAICSEYIRERLIDAYAKMDGERKEV